MNFFSKQQTFVSVLFVGFNREGKQLTKRIKSVSARDHYEASDAIKAMFPAYGYNVRIIFGQASKLAANAISARVARNAGPEEC